jgi:tetratricopeptide (TPR) repeat protein
MAKSTPVPPKQAAPPIQKEKATKEFKIPGTKVLCLLLAIVAFCTYANTFSNSYVLDDLMVVPQNGLVQKGFSAIPDLLHTPYMKGYSNMPNDNYRPLSLITLAIETQVFGVNPGNNHVVNVLLFAFCVVALFLFLLHFFDGKKVGVAFAAALLFAVHPIHTEVVANVKSRDELLCFLFGFLSLYLFIKHARSGALWQLVAGALCYFLSLLSKETSIAFVAIIPGIFLLYHNASKKRGVAIIAATAAVAIAFLGIRYAVLKANHADDPNFLHFIDNQLLNAPNYASRLATVLLVLGYYIKLMFIPAPLICSYAYNSIPTATFGNAWVLLSASVYIGLLVFAVYRLLKNRKNAFAFGILFWIITLGIVSNLFILIGALMAERFVFFASVGFCLIIALLLELWINKAKEQEIFTSGKLWLVLVPVVAVMAVMSVNRNTDWKDNMTLFLADIQKAPNNARLNYYVGNEMSTNYANSASDANMKKQIIGESIPYLQKAVEVYPHYTDAHTSLGTAFFNLANYDSAEVHHKAALVDEPKNVLALNGLAGIYFMKQNFAAARDILVRDVAINPRNTSIVYNLGLCYLNMRQFDSAIVVYRQVLAINPRHKESLASMAQVFTLLNQPDSAKRYEGMAR